MHVSGGVLIVAERIDPQLVAGKMVLVVGADRFAERIEHGAIEPLRVSEVPGAQVDVVEQTADMKFSQRSDLHY